MKMDKPCCAKKTRFRQSSGSMSLSAGFYTATASLCLETALTVLPLVYGCSRRRKCQEHGCRSNLQHGGQFLFGSLAGTVADRLDRRKLMLTSDVFRGVMAICIAIGLFGLHVPFPVLLLMLSLSMFSSLFQAPAFHASVASMVGREHIQQATGPFIWWITWPESADSRQPELPLPPLAALSPY